jgi:hypothetical protein
MYASFLRISGALHLSIFEQPAGDRRAIEKNFQKVKDPFK